MIAAHAGLLLVATAALVLALLAVLIWIVAHLERRIQHLEHEVAHLHALRDDASFPADKDGHIDRALDPSTPEVSRRFKAMVA